MKAHERSTPHITTVWTGPVRLRTSGLAGRVVACVLSLPIVLLLSLPVWDTPRFLRDVWIGLSERRAVLAVSDGPCSSGYRTLLITCAGRYEFMLDGQTYKGRYAFFILTNAGYADLTADVVYVDGHPNLHTLAQAIDYLPNRAAVLVPSLAVTAVFGWVMFREIRFHLRARRRVRSMRVRPVRLVALPAPDSSLMIVEAGVLGFALCERIPRCGRLFVLQSRYDPYRFPDGRALAAVAPGVPFALVIDKRLKGLRLTREERAELQAALAGASSTHVR